MRQHFDSEEELQDMLTKRMLEAQMMVNDDPDDLGEFDPMQGGHSMDGPEMSAMLSPAAKAKSRMLK